MKESKEQVNDVLMVWEYEGRDVSLILETYPCRLVHKLDKVNGGVVYEKKCKKCGNVFYTDALQISYCSKVCSSEVNNENRKKAVRKYVKNNRDKINCYIRERRRRLTGKLNKVFVCPICGKVVNRNEKGKLSAVTCGSKECQYKHRLKLRKEWGEKNPKKQRENALKSYHKCKILREKQAEKQEKNA